MATQHSTRSGWLYQPQRTWLRRAVFQVHLWIGLALALYSIVIGLSGSALVFRQSFEQRSHPQLFHIQQRPATTTLDAAIHRIEAERPGWRASGLENVSDQHVAITLLMARVEAAPDNNYRAVAFDRADGHVLEDHMRFDGTLGWLANLHFYLLRGHAGLLVSGWMAAGLLVLCITGLILWWRGVQRWFEFLWLRVHRLHSSGVNWRRLNWDLHSVVGFWTSALLVVVTTTGLYFCFPGPVRSAVLIVTGSHPTPQTHVQAPAQATAEEKALTVDAVVAKASAALPANAPADYLYIPAKRGMPFSATGYYIGAAPYSKLVRISLDAHTGEVLSYEDTTKLTRGDRIIQSFFAIHFGSFAAGTSFDFAVKLLWVLVGVAPAMLAVTGCILYWNRALRPRWLRHRRRVLAAQ